MAFTEQDLANIETAIINLAMGTRKVKITMGDKTVEYAPAGIEKLRALRDTVAASLPTSSSRPRALLAQTSKGL